MTTICGGDAAEFFAVASFPVLDDVLEAAFADTSVWESKVVKGSACSLGSGLPRRRRGRLGSSIGSSDDDRAGGAVFVGSGGGADLVASGVVCVLAVVAVVGDGVGAVAGFC